MGCDPAADVHADCGDLRAIGPNAGHACHAFGRDVEIREGIDQNLLQGAHIKVNVALPGIQIENRITHQLPRTMICHVAAAIGFLERNTGARQHIRSGQDILLVTVAAHCDHMGMFGEKQLIGDKIRLPIRHRLVLDCKRGFPANAAEIANGERIGQALMARP